jgi:hypothetical protein
MQTHSQQGDHKSPKLITGGINRQMEGHEQTDRQTDRQQDDFIRLLYLLSK